VFVSRLKPAAPSIERSTIWPDTVKRGPMIRQVRGTGTLVPEDIRWIPATTAGRVERIVLRSGAEVKPDSIIVELSNPELERTVVEARLQVESAQAQLTNRRAELESALLTQRATAANVESEWRQAQLRAEADAALSKDGLIDALTAKINRARADDLAHRSEIEKKRLEVAETTLKSQLAVQEAEVKRLSATLALRMQELDKLRVRAGQRGPCRRPVPPQGGAPHPRDPDEGHRDRPGGVGRHPQRVRRGQGVAHRCGSHQRHRDGRHHAERRAAPRGPSRPDGRRHRGT
jgi:HlyD family secretion protein